MESQPTQREQRHTAGVAALVAFLQTTPLFSRVDAAALAEIAPQFETTRYGPDDIVIREGDPGDRLHIVCEGQLRAVSRKDDGTEVFLNLIEAGESVGEIALLTGEPRTATVYATLATVLLSLSRTQFDWLGQHHPDALQALIQAISFRLQEAQLNLALFVGRVFEHLGEPELRALRNELELVSLHSGEVVVRQGEPGDALYVVINGRLRVVLEQEDGSASTLYELRRGQSVGEIGILTGGLRTATVYAVRDSLLARLSRDGFNRLLAAYPQAMVRQFAAPVIQVLQDQTNRARGPDHSVATIAVVPIHPGIPLSAFTGQLVTALSALGPTLHLTSARLEEALARVGIAQTPHDAPASITIIRWLNEQEMRYRYIVYEADPAASPWSERCLRQADRILLVGDAQASPEQSDLERALLPEYHPRVHAQRSLVLLHPPETARPSGTKRWLEARQPLMHYQARRDSQADVARVARLVVGRGVGIVLSGGGAAGFGHIGAIRALRDAGVPIDLIGGTSQGGLMACQYAMGWDYETIMAKNQTAIRHPFDYTFPITALMAGGEMTTVVKEMFGDAQLEDMWIPCFCITANLSHAEMMVHDMGPVWKYTRATTSIPGVLPPVIDDGDMLVDGGLLNNLPTDVMRQRSDCGVVFASDASGSFGASRRYPPPYETSISGWRVLWRRLNPLTPPIRVPTMGQIMVRVAMINDARHMQTSRNLADYYLQLSVGSYGLLEFKALDQIVEAGYRSAQELIEPWKKEERFQALCGTPE